MNLLADNSWLVRLERELQRKRHGPAAVLLAKNRVLLNAIAHAEFLSVGISEIRRRILSRLVWIGGIDHREAALAAALRCRRAKQGKALSLPDAFMAATALRLKCRLVTGDRDYSGIPGLDWSGY
jgi:predicted nucleic acid-binding protein